MIKNVQLVFTNIVKICCVFVPIYMYIYNMSMPNVFDYYNYRVYLGDYYEARKRSDPYFSYRAFAQKAGYNSSGLYMLIVSGERNLTTRYIKGFVQALKLNEKEELYFELMVQYTHALTDAAKQEYFVKMVGLLPEKERRLQLTHKEFYEKWYYVAIHQALGILDIDAENLGDLGSFLRPSIQLREVKKALQVLEELGLIQKSELGFWKPVHRNVAGGAEVGKLQINGFQKNMLDLAKESYDLHVAGDRYSVTESFAISSEMENKIRERIIGFHKEIVAMILADKQKENRVMQWNMQLFPLSEMQNEQQEQG
jgi:uncharacterized protein (TIGR02147 family)